MDPAFSLADELCDFHHDELDPAHLASGRHSMMSSTTTSITLPTRQDRHSTTNSYTEG